MSRLPLRPAANRIDTDPRLQCAARHLHDLGPRPMAHFIAELVDEQVLPPGVLDRLLAWQRLDPAACRAAGGTEWRAPIVRAVPHGRRRERLARWPT
jgi:hypothetical protein